MTTNTAAYQRAYFARNPRDPLKRSIQRHIYYYQHRLHKLPCQRCSHPCPGPGCMTTLHDPYQVLCSFCARTP